MNTFITVISAILVFGFLIFIHEAGHFIFARIFKVTVNEFSIGMGPKLVGYTSKKSGTLYALRAFPFGGYVAMAGENEESEDENGFDRKPAWQRFIITVAGAFVNILFGFIAMLVITALINIGGTEIHSFADTEKTGYEISTEESGLKAGDEIIAIDGKRVKIVDELYYEVQRRGIEPVDVTVIRDGEEQVIKNVVFPTAEVGGERVGLVDFIVWGKRKTFSSFFEYSFRKGALMIRMTYESIYDLITGRYSLGAVSGPVGISSAIGEAARDGFTTLLNIIVIISINLGVMNLLPLPALDGGRMLTILVEMVTRKRIPAKIEGAINGIGLLLLLALSVVILGKDIIALIVG